MESDHRPLSGKMVVVTRPREQSREFIDALRDLGADVIAIPTIRIAPPTDPGGLRDAARAPERFDWIVFTSVNGVDRFWSALAEEGLDTRSLAGVSLCAIGEATGKAIERHGARADLVPREYVAESLVDSFRAMGGLAGKRVLIPRAESARQILPEALEQLGAEVVDVSAYRTISEDEASSEQLSAQLLSEEVDFVTFTSGSSVRNFARIVSEDLGGAKVATIGPITSAAARELGWRVAVEAEVHTVEGLVSAILKYVENGDEEHDD